MANDRQQRAARAEQMRKEREKADKRQRNLISVGIVAVVLILVVVAGVAIKSVSDSNAKDTALNTPANVTDDYGIVYDAAAAGGEPADDPVSVELYEDFQCPGCRSFEATSGEFLKEQVKSGAITITYRPFSFLDELGGSPNRYSHRATNFALCALDAGGPADYQKVHDYLYLNQPEEGTPGAEDAELIEAAKTLGLSGLDSCIKTEKFNRWIDDAKEAGTKNGVTGTPTIYVAGEVVENPTPDVLQKAIDAGAKG
ncbi:MAG: thioredoxin domain-containing protein [Aeromicrobium sp.]|uniref:DsbA family protein n=1 Tax=Aeromicrobium sp. TaxID=1871063 RepID=UPI003C6384FF